MSRQALSVCLSPFFFLSFALLIALVAGNHILGQGGDLTPSGPPAPTMKTLHEVEPRTPLVAGARGVTVNANGGFTISESGSYYLTGNLEVAKGNGIVVSSSNVTTDLQGFEIKGAGEIESVGLDIRNLQTGSPWSGIEIRNGSIFNFGRGCSLIGCVGILKDLKASSCQLGLTSSGSCRFERCEAVGSSIHGFQLGGPSYLVDCIARGNQSAGFILQSSFFTLVNCISQENVQSQDIFSNRGGFWVRESTSTSTFINCQSINDTGRGFSVANGATLRNCTVRDAIGTGVAFYGESDCTLVECSATNATELDRIGIQMLDRACPTGSWL